MKCMKIMAILVSVLTVLSLLSLGISAQGDPTIRVSQAQCQAGEQIRITVSLENNPGITSLKLVLTYDPALTLSEDVQYGDSLGGMTMQPQKKPGKTVLNWFDGANNMSADCIFATLTFTVAEGTAPGTYPIQVQYDPEDVCNIDEQNISFAIADGCVTVAEASSLETATDSPTEPLTASDSEPVAEPVTETATRPVTNPSDGVATKSPSASSAAEYPTESGETDNAPTESESDTEDFTSGCTNSSSTIFIIVGVVLVLGAIAVKQK